MAARMAAAAAKPCPVGTCSNCLKPDSNLRYNMNMFCTRDECKAKATLEVAERRAKQQAAARSSFSSMASTQTAQAPALLQRPMCSQSGVPLPSFTCPSPVCPPSSSLLWRPSSSMQPAHVGRVQKAQAAQALQALQAAQKRREAAMALQRTMQAAQDMRTLISAQAAQKQREAAQAMQTALLQPPAPPQPRPSPLQPSPSPPQPSPSPSKSSITCEDTTDRELMCLPVSLRLGILWRHSTTDEGQLWRRQAALCILEDIVAGRPPGRHGLSSQEFRNAKIDVTKRFLQSRAELWFAGFLQSRTLAAPSPTTL